MPPKKKKQPKDEDDYLPDEDELVESDQEPEEAWDPDYQENHIEEEADNKKRQVLKDEDDEDEEEYERPKKHKEEKEGDEEDLEEDGDLVDYGEFEGEDDIEPPLPQLIKNMIVIPANERTTSERASLFECGRIIGDRAEHLNNKAKPYIDTTNYTSSLEIAYNEFIQKRIPMAVIRHVGQNKVEIWRLSEMTIPKLPPPEQFMLA